MTPRRILLLAGLIGWALLAPSPANAVCPEPHPPVCAEFFHSDVVFVGKLLDIREGTEQGFYPGWYYDFAVQETFRGKVQKNLTVFMENSSGRLTFSFERGRRYLLFASSDPSGGLFIADTCAGNAGPLEEVPDSIRQIEAIDNSTSGGEIRGRIVNRSHSSHSLRGVQVLAQGAQEEYKTVTDDSGWFCMAVPSGQYVVRVVSPDWSFRVYELSYDNPDDIKIEDGSCTAIQFQATPKAP